MGDGYLVSVCVEKVEDREPWREHSNGAAGNQRLSDANCSVDDTLFYGANPNAEWRTWAKVLVGST